MAAGELDSVVGANLKCVTLAGWLAGLHNERAMDGQAVPMSSTRLFLVAIVEPGRPRSRLASSPVWPAHPAACASAGATDAEHQSREAVPVENIRRASERAELSVVIEMFARLKGGGIKDSARRPTGCIAAEPIDQLT